MTRNIFAAFAGAALAAAALTASAETSMTIAYTPNGEAAPIYVAKDMGFFTAHGLNATLVSVPVNSTLPAAVMSGSVQTGTFSPTVFLQAVQNGIDLVAIAGMSVTSHEGARVGIMVGSKSGITSVEGLAGKRIGVPGIGAVLDIMARRVMIEHKVDPNSATYTETPFPVQLDELKAGTVDAVVTVDPFYGRITATGAGKPLANLLDGIPDGETAQFFATSRSWAAAHPDAVAAFRAAVAEGAAYVKAHPDETRAIIGKYLKLPTPILKTIVLPEPDAHITADQIAWWIAVMDKQSLIHEKLDPAKLVLP